MPSKSSGLHVSGSKPTSSVADGHAYLGLEMVASGADMQRNLFKAAGPKHCPHCGGPMKHRKAKVSIGQNCETRDIQLSVCPKCVS
jgi:hypothetical protein